MSGYIGNIPVPQATQSRQSFTATASQTTFATVGYTAGFLDVYLNGVHLLDGTDYTATNGSDIVLTTGAALDDVVEFVAYETFSVLDQSFTGTTTTEALTTTGAFTSLGIDDNATSTAMTLDASGNLLVGRTSDSFSTFGSSYRANGSISATASSNEVLDLNRLGTDGGIMRFFKDSIAVGSLSVSATGASIYLGGTGAANKLDDYEEGTWTPTDASGAGLSLTIQAASYTKIGRLCYIYAYIGYPSNASGVSHATGGLPFTARGGATYAQLTVRVTSNTVSEYNLTFQAVTGSDYGTIHMGAVAITNSALSSQDILISGVYETA